MKKELIGRFANHGQEWKPKGKPEAVNVYDFIDKERGKVKPYGVLDNHNQRKLVEYWGGSRHRRVCRRDHLSVVVGNGPAALS